MKLTLKKHNKPYHGRDERVSKESHCRDDEEEEEAEEESGK